MASVTEQQAATVLPPRRGKVLAIAVDSTARSYNLTALTLGNVPLEAANAQVRNVFVSIQADGAKIYYHFRPDAGADLDNTANVAAGGVAAFANAYGPVLADGSRRSERLTRNLDQYIVVKTATGTGTLYLWPSSDETGNQS